jgi:hypothetical protein
MIDLLLCGALLLQQGPGVVINELSYDDQANDDAEYVELYNSAATPIDIGNWVVAGVDQGGPGLSFTIPAGTTLAPGAFYVMGSPAISNVNQVIIDPGTGASADLFENGPHDALELRNASGQRVDRIDYETYGSNWTPAGGMEGQGWPGGQQASGAGPCTLQRYTDGQDTDDNGLDFRLMPATPGASNDVPPVLPYFDFFDGQAIGTPVNGWGASFVAGEIIDPTRFAGINPSVIPASPQGGNAAIFYDPTGGGNAAMLISEPIQNVTMECYVYLDPTPPTVATNAESWSLGVRGSIDAYGHHPFIDPRFGQITSTSPAIFQTGIIGIAWVFQRTAQYATLWLVDYNNGGDDFTVLHTEQIVAGQNDGWQRLRLKVVDDRVEADFGGTFGLTDGTHISARTSHVVAGGVYIGYREFLTNNGEWRPITLDALTVADTRGEVRSIGTGSPNSNGVAVADVNSLAFVGNGLFEVTGRNLVPSSPAVLLFGFSLRSTPFDLGTLGAPMNTLLYINQQDGLPASVDGQGNTAVPVPVPQNSSFAGAAIDFQFLTVDPTLSGRLPLATSNALEVTIAD